MHCQPSTSKKVILLLYIPWIISELISYYPELSYAVAWLGSFLIIYLTVFSPSSYCCEDRPKANQVMRPFILIQFIFAGFMCCTSIFYFLDHLGYEYLTKVNDQNFLAGEQTARIAKCQRIAVLGHAALMTGIILKTKRTLHLKYRTAITQLPLLMGTYFLCYLASLCVTYLPGLFQFRQPLLNIAISCSAFVLVLCITQKQVTGIIFGSAAFGINIIYSMFSGFKETIILNVILLTFLAYPFYKKFVLLFSVPCICILLYILPTFVAVIRTQSWVQKKSRTQAGSKAYETFFNEQNGQEIAYNNWEFLTNRFSEIGMFTTYVKQVPDQYPYYGTEIIQNSLIALIPRVLWNEKPNTERLAMKRVYKAGVANRSSVVSAKTRPVVDAYLSAGIPGVFIAMLIYGVLVQAICNRAEYLFGGYQFGCMIIFNGLFQPLWRGNTFEFLINNILYAYILMIVLHWILRKTRIITPFIHESNTHHSVL